MDPNNTEPISSDLLPAIVESALDLLQIGQLSSAADRFARERAQNLRVMTDADRALEARIDQSVDLVSSAIAVVRQAAKLSAAFDAGVRAMLQEPSVSQDAANSFQELFDGTDGNFASAALILCDRIERNLSPRDDSADPSPVSGGWPSGCDLIALGAMLGGATCVMGCGERCVAGVGGALIYVAAC